MSSTNDTVGLSRTNAKSNEKGSNSSAAPQTLTKIADPQDWNGNFFVEGVHYKVWCKAWKTTFGDFHWGLANMHTGVGAGGWSSSFMGGLDAIRGYIQQEVKS